MVWFSWHCFGVFMLIALLAAFALAFPVWAVATIFILMDPVFIFPECSAHSLTPTSKDYVL